MVVTRLPRSLSLSLPLSLCRRSLSLWRTPITLPTTRPHTALALTLTTTTHVGRCKPIANAAKNITTAASQAANAASMPSSSTPSSTATVASPFDLTGRTAFITGGSSGVGIAIARTLAASGVRVALASRSLARAQSALSSLESPPGAAGDSIAVECDVRNSTDVERAVEEAHKHFGGRIDFAIHAAGVNTDALIVRTKDDCIFDQIQTNLVGAIYLSRSVSRRMMIQRDADRTPLGGRIIYIGSVVGQQGNVGQSVYAASKAGLHGHKNSLTLSLCKELSSRRVTVNCLCPGYLESGMTSRLTDEVRQSLLARIPTGRMGTAEEVAQMTAFLCTPQASYINGQIIAIDGGIKF